MKIKEVIYFLDQIAPPQLQEDYDNSGLQVGDPESEVTGILCCLDSTEEVVKEAEQKGCNLVLAHHPLLFRGLKRISTDHYVERTVVSAIKKDIAIFAVHTNLDKVLNNGVNEVIAKRLGLSDITPLKVTHNMLSFSFYLERPVNDDLTGSLKEFCTNVYGTAGASGSIRIQGTFSSLLKERFKKFLNLYDIAESEIEFKELQNPDRSVGIGLVGQMPAAVEEKIFLDLLKNRLRTKIVRHSPLVGQSVHKVAICGGAGSFLISNAIKAGVQAFVTSDLKYHDFFEADTKLILCDVGHYESEQFTIELLHKLINEKFTNFAAYLTEVNSNPVNYR